MFIWRRLFYRQLVVKKNLVTQAAFSLLELLIASGIFAVGILGSIDLLVIAARHNQQNYYYSVAANQLANIISELSSSASFSSRHQLIASWNQQNHSLLPHGVGRLHCQNTLCDVEIDWQGFNKNNQLKWSQVYI